MKKLLLIFGLLSLLNVNSVWASAGAHEGGRDSEEQPNLDPIVPIEDPCKGDNSDCYRIELRESIGSTETITGRTGMELTKNYIVLIYKYGASIIGIICVLLIVISGVQISTGGADSENVTQAKTRIFNSLLSLILLFASAMILKTINPGFFRPPRGIEGRAFISKDVKLDDLPSLCGYLADSGGIPDSCFEPNGRRKEGDCAIENDATLCSALGLEGDYNCVQTLQETLKYYRTFDEVASCEGLGGEQLNDGLYGQCTYDAFEAWQNKGVCGTQS